MKIEDSFITISRSMSEAQIKASCEDYINLKKLLALRLNAGDILVERNGRTYKVRGVRAGCADYEILLPGGRAVWVELKTWTGKQSKDQVEFQREVEELGFEYYVIRNVEEFVKALEVK